MENKHSFRPCVEDGVVVEGKCNPYIKQMKIILIEVSISKV